MQQQSFVRVVTFGEQPTTSTGAPPTIVTDAPQRDGKSRSISGFVSRLERDPKRKAALDRARRELLGDLEAAGVRPEQLSALRKRVAMSQSQLAAAVGTTQSYIARIERGQHDPSTRTVRRIAKALGEDPAAVFKAICVLQEDSEP